MALVSKTFSNAVTFTRASSATYFDSAGLLRTAATNAARIDYNPSTLAVRGLLVEEQRTNLLTYSEDFNNAAWPKIRCSISPNATTAPNGSLSADKIIENTDNNTHAIERNTTGLTGGATYTQTIFVKAAERTSVVIGSWDGTTGIDNQFNLSTGTVVVSGAGTIAASIDSVGSGWYRCRVTRAIAAGSTQLSLVVYTHNGTSNIYAGDGTSGFFIWGAQIEAGAFPTSYIPSSVTFSGRTSNGTYFDSAGVLQTAGSGVSRTTYNPSNLTAEPFLLLEESRTNSIHNNTMAGAVAGTPGTLPTNWGTIGAGIGTLTRQVVGTGTINGINYIDIRLSGTTSTGSFGIDLDGVASIAASSGQTWTNSAYVAIVAGSTSNISTIEIRIVDRDLTGLNIGASLTNFISSLTSIFNRTTVTRTLSGVGTAFVSGDILFTFSSGVAIDITLRIGMPQLELGAFPTSVISTSSAAVTRAADTSTSATATRAADLALVNVNGWFYDTEGTLFVQTIKGFTGNFVNYPHTAGLSDGTSSNRIWAGYGVDASQYITPDIATSGSSQLNYTVGLYSMTSVKNAIAYKNNDSQWAFNGTTSATDTLCTIPSNLNKLNIGSDSLGGQRWNGWIRSIKYYPRRLTNAELQALTT